MEEAACDDEAQAEVDAEGETGGAEGAAQAWRTRQGMTGGPETQGSSAMVPGVNISKIPTPAPGSLALKFSNTAPASLALNFELQRQAPWR